MYFVVEIDYVAAVRCVGVVDLDKHVLNIDRVGAFFSVFCHEQATQLFFNGLAVGFDRRFYLLQLTQIRRPYRFGHGEGWLGWRWGHRGCGWQ